MTDNKKLISLLKYCSAPTADCHGCERYELDCGSAHCVEALMSLAADTLEAQQKRIEELENELKDERYRHDRYVDYELAQSRELEKLKAERRWIPVTERLPEVGELVLACAEGEVAETWRESGENWATDPDCGITHWMPIPEPPGEEEK